jgi:transposase
VEQRAEVVKRLQHVLEGANVKLSSVATDVLGVSGRAILDQMIAGPVDPAALAELAKSHLRRKREDLAAALAGTVEHHQRFMLTSLLRQIDFLDLEIVALDEEVKTRTEGRFRAAIQLIDQIPGVGERAAEQILAELGLDMAQFPSAQACASWAKLCPGIHQSADRRKRVGTGKGNVWLRTILIEVAMSASHQRNSYYKALYGRIKARAGGNRATVAVAHAILVTIYHMLSRGTSYEELGPGHLAERDREQVKRAAIRRLERLGFKVSVEDTTEAATTVA